METPAAEAAVAAALEELDRMRCTEGAQLRAELDARRTLLGDPSHRPAQAAAAGAEALRMRLAERVRELRADPAVDESTIAQELSASRIARTSARKRPVPRAPGALATPVGRPEPCGRKLDFLLQEMNREVNTIGSKAEGSACSELVVTAKAELEKMREQVQNVE